MKPVTVDGGVLELARDILVSRWVSPEIQGLARELTRLASLLNAGEGAEAHPDTVIAAIIRDIKLRRGIGQEWEQIDVDVRNEIVAKWRTFFAPPINAQREGE